MLDLVVEIVKENTHGVFLWGVGLIGLLFAIVAYIHDIIITYIKSKESK